MAVYRYSVSRNNYNLVINLFIAVIVMATFMMVCYMVYVPYHGYSRVLSSRSDGVRLEHRYQETRGEGVSGPSRQDSGELAQETKKRTSHFDSLSEESKRMILSKIPDFNSTYFKSKRAGRLQAEPIHILSTNFSSEKCRLPYCSEFLDSENLVRWQECSREATANASIAAANMSSPEQVVDTKTTCRFADQQDRKPVALMSLPGSGNTWVRGLLEAATGICTGGMYCDMSLRANGFVGEQVISGKVLVVKTHSDAPLRRIKKKRTFGSAIVLVRDPFKALVAEWNRKVSNGFRERTTILDSHVTAAGQEWFGRNEKWAEYVEDQMGRWQRVIEQWLISDLIPVLVVQYEALQEDAAHQVRRMLKFLNVEYNDSEVDKRLSKGFESFHRNHHPQGFEHFTEEQKVWVNSMMKDISSILSFNEKSHLLDVDRYISE